MTDAARPIPTSIERSPGLVVTPDGTTPDGQTPTSAAPLRVVRKLTGRGDVLDDGRVVADVDYALRDVEERDADHAPPTVDVTGSPSRRRNVYGLVTCPDAGALADYLGAPVVLHLEDGARLPITVSKVLGPFRYLVQALESVSG
ncbi:MAG TPA: hypothetical protein VF461_04800 [Gemmatimonadaceae bacterium]